VNFAAPQTWRGRAQAKYTLAPTAKRYERKRKSCLPLLELGYLATYAGYALCVNLPVLGMIFTPPRWPPGEGEGEEARKERDCIRRANESASS
jgi:hypothetical protein